MSHFDILPLFFLPKTIRPLTQSDVGQTVKKVAAKFKRNWEEKLTLPQTKKLYEQNIKLFKLF